jgi:DNA end-binding protein Ku
LRYPHEVIPASSLELPPSQEKPKAGELKAAEMLIDAMTKSFDPSEYKDDYEDKLRAALRTRAEGVVPQPAKSKRAATSNVIDLTEVLERSLADVPKKASAAKRAAPAKRSAR